MDETKRLSEWIKRHKKELIIAGVSSAAIVALIFGYRNQEQLTGIRTLWIICFLNEHKI